MDSETRAVVGAFMEYQQVAQGVIEELVIERNRNRLLASRKQAEAQLAATAVAVKNATTDNAVKSAESIRGIAQGDLDRIARELQWYDEKTSGHLGQLGSKLRKRQKAKPKVAAQPERRLGVPSSLRPKKSPEEMGAELRAVQATLTPKARAREIDALISEKIARVHVPDERFAANLFDSTIVIPTGMTLEGAERAIQKQARDRAPRAGSRIRR